MLALALVLMPAGVSWASPPSSTAKNQIQPTTDRDPIDAEALLTAFASMPGLEATFEEEKHLKLLAAPLVSRGKLYFARPGYLARLVETPRPSSVVISPTSLRFHDDRGDGQIDLRSRPDVRTFVESFVRVLAGDRASLAQAYRLSFEPATETQSWRLVLVPSAKPLADLIDRLEVRGRGLVVAEVHVYEHSGDYSITRITDANPKRKFSAEEYYRLFGAEQP